MGPTRMRRESVRIEHDDPAPELYRTRARSSLSRADTRAVRRHLLRGEGGGKAGPHSRGSAQREAMGGEEKGMIVFEIAAVGLALAAVVYLVIALVLPERF